MLTLTQQIETSLELTANAAIFQALSAANQLSGCQHGWLRGPPTSEPEAVAALVSVGCPATASSWKPILNLLGYQVQIIGVYCHQKPYVKFADSNGQQQTRELADLLLVIDDMQANDRRALLVQAKLINGTPYRLATPSDLAQFDLYDNWPLFNFKAAALKRQTSFNLHSAAAPGIASESGCYGAVDILPNPVRWEQLAPSLRLVPGAGYPLGHALTQMISGTAGRAAIIGGADDWSQCVDALLANTYHAVARGYSGLPTRGTTSIVFWGERADFGGIGFSISGSPPGGTEEGDVPEDDGPGSLIHIRLTRFDPRD